MIRTAPKDSYFIQKCRGWLSRSHECWLVKGRAREAGQNVEGGTLRRPVAGGKARVNEMAGGNSAAVTAAIGETSLTV